jgi:hypothetical protein
MGQHQTNLEQPKRGKKRSRQYTKRQSGKKKKKESKQGSKAVLLY